VFGLLSSALAGRRYVLSGWQLPGGNFDVLNRIDTRRAGT